MLYPKIVCDLICLFIPKKKNRDNIRRKYMKHNNLQSIELRLNDTIDNLNNLHENFNRFINTFYSPLDCKKATGTVRKIQLVNILLLEKFKKFCDDNDIKFWLQAGTLLGAVRHKGFVPWDDDCDLGIMREDYIKLEKALSKTQSDFIIDNYYIISKKYYPNFFRTKRIVFAGIEELFIDLVIYDFASGQDEEIWKDYKNQKNMMHNKILKQNFQYGYIEPSSNLSNKDLTFVNNFYDSQVNNWHKKYEQTKHDYVIIGIDTINTGFKRLYKYDVIFPLKELEFEGKIYNVPNNYDEYLTRQYGDYMKLPKDFGVQKHITNIDVNKLNEFLSKGD